MFKCAGALTPLGMFTSTYTASINMCLRASMQVHCPRCACRIRRGPNAATQLVQPFEVGYVALPTTLTCCYAFVVTVMVFFLFA